MRKGSHHTPEAIEKSRQAKLGKKFHLGFTHSPEAKLKMSLAKKGKTGRSLKPETLEKMKQAQSNRSDEWRENIAKSKLNKPRFDMRGENNPQYIDGRTPIGKTIRHSLEYKIWRRGVFERDNYTCVWCGARSAKGNPVTLNADHIKPFAYYPELRFALDNGRTLCLPCHKTTDTYLKKIKFTN